MSRLFKLCFVLTLTLLPLGLTARGDSGRYYHSVRLDPGDSENEVVRKAAFVVPTPRQFDWQELEYVAFIHFGMNTFTGREWGNGKEDPRLFNPSHFDARQWARTVKAAGMKMIVVTAKHHDGFCLWPSAYTEHSVKNSPWRNGKGDVIREVAEACRGEGLKLGIYLSPWDRHEPTYGTRAYNDYYKRQVRELLSNYGEISDFWLDGAGMGLKWMRMKKLYDWAGYYAIIRELQPQAAISSIGPDTRWCGNEAGNTRESEWSVIPEHFDYQADNIGGRAQLMKAARRGDRLVWYPAFIDTSIRPGWFYHASQDNKVKSLERLLDIYYGSVGGNGLLLLNLPPDQRGLIHENDVQRVLELADVLERTFAVNLAKGAGAAASEFREHSSEHGADKTIDGDKDTYWTTDNRVSAATIEYDLGEPRTFNVAMLQEYIKMGQRVEEFYLEAWNGKEWKPLSRSTTIGYKRLLRFNEVTTQKVRVRITQSRARPTISEFGLYLAPTI